MTVDRGRLRHVGHLTRRWVSSLSARPPKPADEQWARLCLNPHEVSLWSMMPNPDKRHSIRVALSFLERRPQASRSEVAGALLHDVGKTVCGLGVAGRVVATIVGPHTRRFREYHDHEAIGARLAEQAGSDPVTVALIAADENAPGIADLIAADDGC